MAQSLYISQINAKIVLKKFNPKQAKKDRNTLKKLITPTPYANVNLNASSDGSYFEKMNQ